MTALKGVVHETLKEPEELLTRWAHGNRDHPLSLTFPTRLRETPFQPRPALSLRERKAVGPRALNDPDSGQGARL